MESLYVTNLPNKLQKADLRLSLYTLFSTYGPVLDVVAMRTAKMRGQAHVVFRDIQTSTQAMRALQDFEFFGQQLKIQYARGRSNIFQRLEGTYKPPGSAAEVVPDARQSLFNAPMATGSAPPPASLPSKPIPAAVANGTKPDDEVAQGEKRKRDDESDEEEAPMEEDSDVPMEASSDED